MKNILFVIDRDLLSNSATHVHSLANSLSALGMDCVIAIPANKEDVKKMGAVHYSVMEYNETAELPKLFLNGLGPDITHCWTPREIVRKFCDRLRYLYQFRLVIHLEDNEELLTQKLYKNEVSLNDEDFPDTYSHPIRYREFLGSANGVTLIIEDLKEFVPENIPSVTLWPGVDTDLFFPRPPNPDLARYLRVPFNSWLIVYTGNVHGANAAEVRSLYLAVVLLNREGVPAFLIRTGKDLTDHLADLRQWVKPFCLELGFVDKRTIPDLIALADVLIQPGEQDAFNKYRFPSKLPEFMAMGKPVILPAANIGEKMTNGVHALVLKKADASNIVDAVKRIYADARLRNELSEGALRFARENFSWEDRGVKLKQFYQSLF